jgi:hypothetical protein
MIRRRKIDSFHHESLMLRSERRWKMAGKLREIQNFN